MYTHTVLYSALSQNNLCIKTKPVTAGTNSSLAHAESQTYTAVSAPSVTGLVLNGDSDYRWDSVLVLDNILYKHKAEKIRQHFLWLENEKEEITLKM